MSQVLQSPVSSPQASPEVEASDRPKQAQRHNDVTLPIWPLLIWTLTRELGVQLFNFIEFPFWGMC